jgi:uncharacterized protein
VAEHTDAHLSHPDIIKRLKRAHGHLAKVIAMLEAERPCVDVAQQIYAVERAIVQAKRTLIHDHIDHCVTSEPGEAALDDLKALTKVL